MLHNLLDTRPPLCFGPVGMGGVLQGSRGKSPLSLPSSLQPFSPSGCLFPLLSSFCIAHTASITSPKCHFDHVTCCQEFQMFLQKIKFPSQISSPPDDSPLSSYSFPALPPHPDPVPTPWSQPCPVSLLCSPDGGANPSLFCVRACSVPSAVSDPLWPDGMFLELSRQEY